MIESVLYLMHVDWDWIKQRPHFLAQELARHLAIHVAYYKYYRRVQLVDNTRDERLSYSSLFRLPGRVARLPGLRWLDQAALHLQVRAILRPRCFDAVWLTS